MGGPKATTSEELKKEYAWVWDGSRKEAIEQNALGIGNIAKGIQSQYDQLVKSEAANAKQEATQDSINNMILNPPKDAPDPTQIAPNTANDELKRQKRLEGLRAGLLSTIKSKGTRTSSNPLISPDNLYGKGLKSKLGM